MKTEICVLLASGALLSSSFAQSAAPAAASATSSEVAAVGLTPSQKRAIPVPATEENPFAVVNDNVEIKEDYEDVSAQEQKIRSVFNSLNVSGVTRSGTGYKVLIGDMILREGQIVPAVIRDQTEQLEVTSITEDEMVISWVDNDDDRPRSRRKTNSQRQLKVEINRGARVMPRLPRSVSASRGRR